MIVVILVAALVAAIVSAGFITFFWLKIKHEEIDKFDLNLQEDSPTHTKYKNKQKQWGIEQALFDKIRRERKIESEQETAEIDVQKIPSIQKHS